MKTDRGRKRGRERKNMMGAGIWKNSRARGAGWGERSQCDKWNSFRNSPNRLTGESAALRRATT